nr:putative reverse transcriptase domain-containing protein [Tanacetum cinerariifolium]
MADTETSTEFMQRFLRLAGFLGATAGTAEEQAKNFQWGLRKSTLNHLMCILFTDVAQVANAARNYEILHERDDDDAERPDKRQKSGDRHQPTTQQSSHRNHGHNNDRHGSDRRGSDDNHCNNNNYSGNNRRGPLRATPTRSALRVDADTQESVVELLFDDKIYAINAFPLDMCEFDIILGMDWLTEHHATIDCRSYRVIFDDIHAPEFINHGSLSGKSMQIIYALQARTLLSHGCEGFLATIHDTTSDVPSIHDQPIVSEFPDVFPDELPGIPLIREVEFSIEPILGAEPISKAPYRMAPIELKERGGGDNHRSNNNYSGNNRSSGNGRDQRNRGQQSNRLVNFGFQQSRGPSEGYSYPVCTTCRRRHLGECHRAAGTCFKCGQTGHLQKDCKKNTMASTSGQADKKPGASGRVFTIIEDHATKTS